MRIAYVTIFGIPRADVGAADFLMGTPFYNAYRMAYRIYSPAYAG